MRFFRKCSVFRRSIPLIFELELKRMDEKEKTSCAINLSDEPRWSLKTKKKNRPYFVSKESHFIAFNNCRDLFLL